MFPQPDKQIRFLKSLSPLSESTCSLTLHSDGIESLIDFDYCLGVLNGLVVTTYTPLVGAQSFSLTSRLKLLPNLEILSKALLRLKRHEDLG
jgi:hypothetical protein